MGTINPTIEEPLIEQMEEYFKISKYLEIENETEFFKQATVLFERYIEKSYKGSLDRPTHLQRRDWFFNELSNNNIPWAMSAKRFVQVLNKCRNYIMHNLDPRVDKEILRSKLIIQLREIFGEIMRLKDGFPDDKNTIKKEIIRFGKENLSFMDKEMFTKLKEHFGDDVSRELVTYDSHLHAIITNVYMLIDGTVKGINKRSS